MAIRYPEDFEIVQCYGVGDYSYTIWKYTNGDISFCIETATCNLNAQMMRDRQFKEDLEKQNIQEKSND
jgi:hypothetical protein